MSDKTIQEPRLEITNIDKRYGPIVACRNISLSVNKGEVHGLLGQNGAGKSTLMKVVAGVIQPDKGSISIEGEKQNFKTTGDANSAGVGMVHQHFSLVGNLTVWENISLGTHGPVKKMEIIEQISKVSTRYGLEIEPTELVQNLSIGEKQRVELIKCLQRSPDLIVLDEPTSVLSPIDAHQLFSVIREMAIKESKSVVLVSHRLEEMLLVADKISVMRDGDLVHSVEAKNSDANSLAREMLGSDYEKSDYEKLSSNNTLFEKQINTFGDTSEGLCFESFNISSGDSRVGINNLNLSLPPGEIHGLAGVEGNGQDVLVETLSNLRKPDSGELRINGKKIHFSSQSELTNAGISVVPSDRHASGCILDMTLAENLAFGKLESFVERGRINNSKLRKYAALLADEYRIIAPSLDTPFRFLSGGNQQRAVLAREISKSPKVLVVSQPTFGLDINAMSFVWNRIREVANEGVSVLLISNNLEEILDLSNTISVINRGTIVGAMTRQEFDAEKLGLMMGEH